jgi:hypothetical protein
MSIIGSSDNQKGLNMKKTKQRLAVLIAALAIGAVSLVNAPSLSAQETDKNKTPNKSLAALQHERDSLINANADMFNRAQNEYYEHLDKKYTMRLFFSRRELKNLNEVLDKYLKIFADKTALTGEESIEYKYIKAILPFKQDTPFSVINYVLLKLGVPSEALAPLGIIIYQGTVIEFKDEAKQNNFECYEDAFAGGRMHDGDLPDEKEFSRIAKAWDANKRRIEESQELMMMYGTGNQQ